MKVRILSEKSNELLERKEIEAEIEHEDAPTPSKAALQQYVSKERGVDAAHVEIVSIFSSKGNRTSKSSVYIWNEKKADDLSKPKEKTE
ncbi:MAG: hypothetical protein HYW27_00065 [Candidatus Aenigmarchaeota archaeon]|nr:hypothetical protein [Candidatus Aenigmarchaeota archaeon]